MTILVTGGKGFLGGALIHRLLERGHEVVCLDRKTTPGRLGDVADRVTFVGGGLCGVQPLVDLIAEHHVDAIAHLVYRPVRDDIGGLREELETMVGGTADVFEAAARARVRRVVFPSSIHYYGRQEAHGEVTLSESAPSLAETMYGITKQLNERVAALYTRMTGTTVVSLRIPAVYGPGAELGARAVNLAAVAAGRGQPAVIPFPPEDRVCLAHVDDVADCIASALLADQPAFDVYNIGGTTLSYREIVSLVEELVPDADLSFDPDAEPTDLPYLIDDARARRELGLRHRPVADGIREVIAAAREGSARAVPAKEH
jgi:UDP-glucose 4-epimerase